MYINIYISFAFPLYKQHKLCDIHMIITHRA